MRCQGGLSTAFDVRLTKNRRHVRFDGRFGHMHFVCYLLIQTGPR
jgi:hypothetical protein